MEDKTPIRESKAPRHAKLFGIMNKTGMAVYKLPNGKLVASKKLAEVRYPKKTLP